MIPSSTTLLPRVSNDPTPVEKAIANSIADGFEAEAFLWINFHRPDSGVRVWYAWTAGGVPLAERCDSQALALVLDCADWLHVLGLHRADHFRGRVHTQAHPLRPVLQDIQRGERAPQELRKQLHRIIQLAAEHTGHAPMSRARPIPRWGGVGPALLARTDGRA